MPVSPRPIRGTVAAVELVLLAPAALLMTALFVRDIGREPYEPAHSAARIVLWYAVRPWTLWVLLRALPLAGLVTGAATLLREWRVDADLRRSATQTLATVRAHLAVLFIVAATVVAAGVLAIVAVHALTD